MLASSAAVVLLACFFYRSAWSVLPLSPVGAVCFLELRRAVSRRAREELVCQFRECILSVSASLNAGYSVENAFLESERDMLQMYGGESAVCRELGLIRRGLHINITLEELLKDLGDRSGCEEIEQFAEVFSIAKRSGGNLSGIIAGSAELIGGRIDLRRELDTLLGGKRMELAIMKAMPFAIMLYIELANPGYFDILYHNLRGILIMTGCLAAYLGAYAAGELVIRRMEV